MASNLKFVYRAFVELAIFSAVINVLLLVMPIYLLQIYDRVLPSSSTETLIYLSVIAVGALVVLGLLEVIRSFYAGRIASRLDRQFGAQSLLAALTTPRAALGDIEPLRDLAMIRAFISSRMIFFIFDLPFAPLFIVVLYFIHPLLFTITLVGALVMLFLAVLNQLTTARSSAKNGVAIAANMNLAQAYARDFETVKALGMTGNIIERWGSRFADGSVGFANNFRVNAIYGGISRSFRMLIQIAVLGMGAYLVLAGQITAGMIFASSIISGRALQPLDQIVGSWRQIVDAKRAYRRLWHVVISRLDNQKRTTPLPEPKGKLSVDNLIYYPPNSKSGDPPTIKRVNFTLDAGQTLAVIGPSCAGKSTLARLIVGAIQPSSGCIRLDGADISQIDTDTFGKSIGYLSQDVRFFPGSIAQNISRFTLDVDGGNVVEASRRAFVHELILTQSSGYETQMGPTGEKLSGGERQRIGLARALFGNPCLLVLDEPNAHLDIVGEKALESSLTVVKESGATTLIITHRLSIASKCDRVLLLKDGSVELFGPPNEILPKLVMEEPEKKGRQQTALRTASTASKPTSASFSRVMRARTT